MIFITVGTHEQPFDRLIREVDRLVGEGRIADDVVMQIGYCTYEPRHCQWSKLLSYEEMKRNIENADIIITHGGPASFLAPLQIGKIPIVVPRQKQYGEHVNDHQLEFCREVEKRLGNIILVEDVGELGEKLEEYGKIKGKWKSKLSTKNNSFVSEFNQIVENMNFT